MSKALWHLPAAPDPTEKRSHHVGLLSNQHDYECIVLAALGHTNYAITRATGLSTGQISYRLAKARATMEKLNMTRWGWRNGLSPLSKAVVEAAARRVAPTITKALRQLPPNTNGHVIDV